VKIPHVVRVVKGVEYDWHNLGSGIRHPRDSLARGFHLVHQYFRIVGCMQREQGKAKESADGASKVVPVQTVLITHEFEMWREYGDRGLTNKCPNVNEIF
jgi:hypothetical protein